MLCCLGCECGDQKFLKLCVRHLPWHFRTLCAGISGRVLLSVESAFLGKSDFQSNRLLELSVTHPPIFFKHVVFNRHLYINQTYLLCLLEFMNKGNPIARLCALMVFIASKAIDSLPIKIIWSIARVIAV